MSEMINRAINMINDWAISRGIKPEQVYDPQTRTWSLVRGSAKVQISLLSIPIGNNMVREYLQVASPIIKVPKGKECQFYKKLLEINDVKLGVKMSLQKDTDQVWALAERDLEGIDYNELVTVIEDLGYWADLLDDELNKEFF